MKQLQRVFLVPVVAAAMLACVSSPVTAGIFFYEDEVIGDALTGFEIYQDGMGDWYSLPAAGSSFEDASFVVNTDVPLYLRVNGSDDSIFLVEAANLGQGHVLWDYGAEIYGDSVDLFGNWLYSNFAEDQSYGVYMGDAPQVSSPLVPEPGTAALISCGLLMLRPSRRGR